MGPGLEKLANPCDLLPRNEKRPAVDLSMPSVNSFGRQSSNSDESSPSATLFVTILSALEIRKALQRKDLRSSRPVWSVSLRRGSNYGLTPSLEMITTIHFRNNRKKRLVRHSPFHHSPPVCTSPLTSRPDQCDELHCVSFHSWEAKLVRKQPDSRACFGSYTLVTGEPTGMDRVKRC